MLNGEELHMAVSGSSRAVGGVGEENRNSLISPYTLTVLWVSLASVLAIALICLRRFDVPLLLLLATLLTAAMLAVFRVRIRWSLPKLGIGFVAIAALALFLRSDLDPHLKAGQDQGLYTNMSAQLLRAKALDYTDEFRASLSGEELRMYDSAPMAAVDLVDPVRSRYVVAFYPLHPAWMAMSTWAFGQNYHTASLLLFAALGIAGGYYLALLLFGSRRAAGLAAAFLALNPALVFFAKFPVTEMVAFAFTVNGFLFFAKACFEVARGKRWLFLLIAVLCFNGLFYTRMQFFLYIPFMGLLFAYALIAIRQPWSRRVVMMVFPASLVITFLLSMAFYRYYQPILYGGMVEGHLDKLKKLAALMAAGLGLVVLGLLAYVVARRPTLAVLERLNDQILRWSGKVTWLLPLALLASIPSVVALYQTGSLAPFPWTVPVGTDPFLVRYHAIYRLAQMLSPLGVALLLLLPAFRIAWSGAAKFGLLFLVLVWAAVLTQPAIPYLYYYGRYLAGDMLPYSLILTAGVIAYLWDGRWRRLAIAITAFQCLFFLVFSIAQYNHDEGEDPRFFERIAELVSPNDIIIASGLDDAQLVGLRVTYNLNVFSITGRGSVPLPFDTGTWHRLEANAHQKGGRLYLLTNQRPSALQEQLVERVPFRQGYMSNSEHAQAGNMFQPTSRSRLLLPLRFKQAEVEINLYRIDTSTFDRVANASCTDELGLATDGAILVKGLNGFSSPETHGRWTDGKRASYTCTLPEGHSASTVEIQATAYLPNGRKQRVGVSVNGGAPQQFEFAPGNDTQRLQIPVGNTDKRSLTVDFDLPDAISPQQAQSANDARVLGISISEIEIKE
ncbi:DUF7024 domain-containing protein [Bacillus altitudinis]